MGCVWESWWGFFLFFPGSAQLLHTTSEGGRGLLRTIMQTLCNSRQLEAIGKDCQSPRGSRRGHPCGDIAPSIEKPLFYGADATDSVSGAARLARAGGPVSPLVWGLPAAQEPPISSSPIRFHRDSTNGAGTRTETYTGAGSWTKNTPGGGPQRGVGVDYFFSKTRSKSLP